MTISHITCLWRRRRLLVARFLIIGHMLGSVARVDASRCAFTLSCEFMTVEAIVNRKRALTANLRFIKVRLHGELRAV